MQVFLVRKSAVLQRKVLSVRVAEDQLRTTISHFPVRETKYSKQHVWIVGMFGKTILIVAVNSDNLKTT